MNLHLLYMRKVAGLSKSELARRIGVNRATILSWENGQTEPSNAYVRRFAEETGHTVKYQVIGQRVKTVFFPTEGRGNEVGSKL